MSLLLKQTLRFEGTILILHVAFLPDLNFIASTSEDGTVRLWDANTGALKQTLEGHSHRNSDVAFSPNGKFLASASNDDTVRLWDATTGSCKQTLEDHNHLDYTVALSFSPD